MGRYGEDQGRRVISLADPWGPPKKLHLTSLNAYVQAWNKLDIEEFQIEARWEDGQPIFTQDQLVHILTVMDPLGALHNLVNSSGEITTVAGSSISTNTSQTHRWSIGHEYPRISRWASSSADLNGQLNQNREYGALGAMTLAGGALANHVLSAAIASYADVIELIGLWSDTADTYTLEFDDEDGTDLLGLPIALDVEVAAGEVTWLHRAAGWAAADNKDLRVSVSGGAGVEELFLIYELHRE